MVFMKKLACCAGWIVAVLAVPGPAPAELPIPKDPQWTPVRDDVYLQEVEGRIETREPLLAAAVLDNVLYVGGPHGVQRLQGDALVPAGGPEGTVKRLKTLKGALYAFPEKGLWRFHKSGWKKISDDTFADGCVHAGDVILASPTHLYRFEPDKLTALHDSASGLPILGVASYAETLYVRHAKELSLFRQGRFDSQSVQDWGALPPGATTRDLLALGSRLLVPTDKGLAVLRGMSWSTLTGNEGLCYEDTTCAAAGFEKQDYWIGTMRGAIRSINNEYQYFGPQRWITHDKVNAIASGDRVVYVATDGGLGIITYEPYTLQKKAAWYERWIDEWGMRRVGFISTLVWDSQRKEWVRFISDNDGGWAGHLLNGLCFKYAVTKDPEVREQALDVFRSLKWCEEISGIRGFPAR